MASKVGIANNALTNLGADRIMSFTEDSENARNVNNIFDQTLDMILQDHPWNFARYRQELAQTVDTPVFDYDYQYTLPTNPYCLRVLRAEDDKNFVIEGRKLLTDETIISIEYIGRIVDMNLLSALFIEAFSYYLSMKLAYAIPGSGKQREFNEQDYILMLKKAKSRDAQEGNKEIVQDKGNWYNARF
ncbi:MAG: hypothetical protein ACTSQ0_02980 [Candidatus Heimdallarchaeota archaeon]